MSQRVDIADLRRQANELEGKFDLYDYAGDDLREAWLDQAQELRERADSIQKRRRKKAAIARKEAETL